MRRARQVVPYGIRLFVGLLIGLVAGFGRGGPGGAVCVCLGQQTLPSQKGKIAHSSEYSAGEKTLRPLPQATPRERLWDNTASFGQERLAHPATQHELLSEQNPHHRQAGSGFAGAVAQPQIASSGDGTQEMRPSVLGVSMGKAQDGFSGGEVSAASFGLGRREHEQHPLQGEVWLIRTHEVQWQTDLAEAFSSVQYWRLGGSATWEFVEQGQFFSEMARPTPTVIYIHGNWSDPDAALQQAWTLYRPIGEAAGNRRFRLVIWSWPAERTAARLLTEFRFKAGRSDVEAYLMARHLERFCPSEPILLVGYSFGARVITGALHLVGGGRLMGRSLIPNGTRNSDQRHAEFRSACSPSSGRGKSSAGAGRFRAILVAAAIGNDWLLPGGRHQQACCQLEKLLVTVNPADPALRWYHRLESCESPALGWIGPPTENPLQDSDGKIECLWVTSWVGKEHNWRLYLQHPELQARLIEYLFESPSPAPQP